MFTLKIKMENEAFSGEPHVEVARILHELATEMELEGDLFDGKVLHDVNGNGVGVVKVSG